MSDNTLIFDDDFREDTADAQNRILQDEVPIDLGFKTSEGVPDEDEEQAEDYMPPNEEEYTSNEIATKKWYEFCDLTKHPGFEVFYFDLLKGLIESTKHVLTNPDLRLMANNNTVLYTANDVNCIILSLLMKLQAEPVEYIKKLQLMMNQTNSLFVQKAVEDFYNKSGMDLPKNTGSQS